MSGENGRSAERRVWLGYLSEKVKPGMVVEFGCGSGSVLEILSAQFPESVFVGIDKSVERLAAMSERELRNVIPVRADISENVFQDHTFDTGLFVGSLHEVYSYLGEKKVQSTFKMAHDVLKGSGLVIIQDFLKPYPRKVRIGFKNDVTCEKFLRFSEEFRPRKIRYERKKSGFVLDLADAVEFISKYRSPSEEDWTEEMNETHFFFTEQQYREVARRTGFVAGTLTRLPRSETWWAERRKDIRFEYESEYVWIQFVLKKGQF